jgi:hypothetical protein
MAQPSLGAMVKKARPPHLMAIVNDLLAGVATTDKENEENEGRRDISCLGESFSVMLRSSGHSYDFAETLRSSEGCGS